MAEKVNGLVVEVVKRFAEKKAKYDKVTAKFAEYKEHFERVLEEQLAGSIDAKKKLVVTAGDKTITVTRVEKTSIEWSIEKLKKKLSPAVLSKCVRKRYEIYDMKGLSRYLKACNVDPKIFRNYLLITETPDSELIDEAAYRGLLGPNDISGCYTVNKSKPHYQVRIKEGENKMDESRTC